jgi:hypothetical protein
VSLKLAANRTWKHLHHHSSIVLHICKPVLKSVCLVDIPIKHDQKRVACTGGTYSTVPLVMHRRLVNCKTQTNKGEAHCVGSGKGKNVNPLQTRVRKSLFLASRKTHSKKVSPEYSSWGSQRKVDPFGLVARSCKLLLELSRGQIWASFALKPNGSFPVSFGKAMEG